MKLCNVFLFIPAFPFDFVLFFKMQKVGGVTPVASHNPIWIHQWNILIQGEAAVWYIFHAEAVWSAPYCRLSLYTGLEIYKFIFHNPYGLVPNLKRIISGFNITCIFIIFIVCKRITMCKSCMCLVIWTVQKRLAKGFAHGPLSKPSASEDAEPWALRISHKRWIRLTDQSCWNASNNNKWILKIDADL